METLDFNVKELGYDVVYLKRDDQEILFRVNVKDQDDFERYKTAVYGKLGPTKYRQLPTTTANYLQLPSVQ